MKRKIFALTVFFLALAAFGSARTRNGPNALAEKIQKASSLLLDSEKSEDKSQGFLLLVESVDLAAEGGNFPAGFQGEIRGALEIFRQGSILDAQGGNKLKKAHALLNPGRPFQMPPEVASIEQAVAYGRIQVQSALAQVNAGKKAEAVGPLLEVLLMVITPMEAPGR